MSKSTCRPQYRWPGRYVLRDTISKAYENTPLAVRLGFATSGHADAVGVVLAAGKEPCQNQYQVSSVLDLCHGKDCQHMIEGGMGSLRAKNAVLIDGNNIYGVPIVRKPLGGLTSGELFEQLHMQRYIIKKDVNCDLVDAERRLIYVTDLSQESLSVLVETAPESLARLLGEFFFRYLASHISMSVSFASDGPEIFSLEFCLPIYAWRSSDSLMKDARHWRSTGCSLRPSEDLTFLRHLAGMQNPEGVVDGLYRGQVSCLVSGYDQSHWTGLLLMDTWFEDVAEPYTPDLVQRYDDDLGDGMVWDPLSRAHDEALKSYWFPRPYFLRIFELRLAQIRHEWEQLLYYLTERAVGMSSCSRYLLCRAQDPHATKNLPGFTFDQQLNGLERGSVILISHLRKLIIDLQEIVKIGSLFMETDCRYFMNGSGCPEDDAKCFPHLAQIRNAFKGLNQLKIKFIHLENTCAGIIHDCKAARGQSNLQIPINPVRLVPFADTFSGSLWSIMANRQHIVRHDHILLSITLWVSVIAIVMAFNSLIFGSVWQRVASTFAIVTFMVGAYNLVRSRHISVDALFDYRIPQLASGYSLAA